VARHRFGFLPSYFYLLDERTFVEQIRPALAAGWQRRSFEPCRELCRQLLPAAKAFADRYHLGSEEPLLSQVVRGLPFDRHFWRLLAGEIFLFSAAEIPEIQTAAESFCCLLEPKRYQEAHTPREQFAPIQQVHYGSRDLVFGTAYYRPDHAGWNDHADVGRLVSYMTSLDPSQWTIAGLAPLRELDGDQERAEELEFLRDWFGPLRDMYERASARMQVIICDIE
jgi:hypothetical protein